MGQGRERDDCKDGFGSTSSKNRKDGGTHVRNGDTNDHNVKFIPQKLIEKDLIFYAGRKSKRIH